MNKDIQITGLGVTETPS